MRRQPVRLVLIIGLCAATLSGCAHLRQTDLDSAVVSDIEAMDTQSIWPKTNAKKAKSDFRSPPVSVQPRANLLEGQFAMARLSERRDETDQAEQAYLALLKMAPRDARLHHRLGVIALKKGDFAAAEKRLHKAKSFAPPTAELLSDIGYCYYLQRRLPEAEAVLKEALRLEPSYATATNNLGLVVGAQGRFKESLDLFKHSNTEAEAYANLAYVLGQRGDLVQAKQMYHRALTLNTTMRAAAQAMVQIDNREKTQSKFVAESPNPRPVALPPSQTKPVLEQPHIMATVESLPLAQVATKPLPEQRHIETAAELPPPRPQSVANQVPQQKPVETTAGLLPTRPQSIAKPMPEQKPVEIAYKPLPPPPQNVAKPEPEQKRIEMAVGLLPPPPQSVAKPEPEQRRVEMAVGLLPPPPQNVAKQVSEQNRVEMAVGLLPPPPQSVAVPAPKQDNVDAAVVLLSAPPSDGPGREIEQTVAIEEVAVQDFGPQATARPTEAGSNEVFIESRPE